MNVNMKTEEEVKEILLSYGYIKIGDYNGARNSIKCYDSEGYIVYPVLYRLKEGKTPLRFHRSNPDSINNIKHYIAINNINVVLLSDGFVCAHDKLLFECACKRTYETSLSNFIYGNKHCCNDCALLYGTHIMPFKILIEKLQARGLTPLFSENDYNGATTTKLAISNENGYKALLAPQHFDSSNKKPSWFHKSNPYTMENINLYLEQTTNGEYMCINNEYNGKRDALTILHKKCGKTFSTTWGNLYRKPTKKEPNRHGTRCPYCTGLRSQSLHAVVLKQLFLRLREGTVVEDPSCRNPLTNCILPTDIVNHKERIAIEIQSWFHDNPSQMVKDQIKKDYWEKRGYAVYRPDIRDFSVVEMVQLFFPEITEIPEWVSYEFESKFNVDMAQELLNSGLTATEVANVMEVSPHKIYDNIYHKKLYYPQHYPNKKMIKKEYFNQQETLQTAG